ncbi:MAG: Tfp pilus assembly protein, ATPase PilM [uncultured bacterium]|nr:MAG: Tfp pilus assembly protein, ATPase PilM [uncultured bacterium]OGT54884.1 MAG: hypothetical protein A3F43_00540 [Gammaproteobacteria bacterium RIFCSPHIGHO2_12_FULL_42_10]
MRYLIHSKQTIGIAIQSAGIFMLQLQKRKNRWHRLHQTHYLFEESIYREGQIADWALLEKYFQKLIEIEHLKNKTVVMNLPSQFVYVQQIILPPTLDEDEIESEIVFKLQQISPYVTKHWRIDFEIITADQHQQIVHFVATPEQYLLQYLDFIKQIRLQVNIVDVDMLALERSIADCFALNQVDYPLDISQWLVKDSYLLAHGLAMRG